MKQIQNNDYKYERHYNYSLRRVGIISKYTGEEGLAPMYRF